MGVGKKASGLKVREAGSDGGGDRFSAGVEPGERVGGRAERDQQRAPSVGRIALVPQTGGAGPRSAQPEVNVGLVFGLVPGRAQSGGSSLTSPFASKPAASRKRLIAGYSEVSDMAEMCNCIPRRYKRDRWLD
jgi:hypothetical protein